jgi:hypothetical protein
VRSIFSNMIVVPVLQASLIKPRTMSSTRLNQVAQSIDYDEFTTLLGPILRSRVPGTNGHHAVKQVYILSNLK